MNAYFSRAVLAVALAAGCAALARAQMAPGDTGAGDKLGIQQLNQSGEVGSVTLFPRGPNATLVVLDVQQAPSHPQPAAIHRGHECDQIQPQPAIRLRPVVGGHSATIVPIPEDRLMSGNYDVVVHANNADSTRYVNCGHLHR